MACKEVNEFALGGVVWLISLVNVTFFFGYSWSSLRAGVDLIIFKTFQNVDTAHTQKTARGVFNSFTS